MSINKAELKLKIRDYAATFYISVLSLFYFDNRMSSFVLKHFLYFCTFILFF